MQCYPPSCGLQNHALFHSFNSASPIPLPYNTPYPDIIGEGEVTSVVFPDGSIQFYFTPMNMRWPYGLNDNACSQPHHWRSNGVWFVRNFPNLIPPVACNQHWQKSSIDPFGNPFFKSDCNVNNISPGFQLKFHNDSWTSTTDLHYFYPSIRKCHWFTPFPTKESTCVQVEIPTEPKITCQSPAICNKPCNCSMHDKETKNKPVQCSCESNMSIVYSKTKHNSRTLKKRSSSKIKTHKSSQCIKKGKKKASQVSCACERPQTTDKSLTTYTDQASNCVSEKGHQTKSYRCGQASTAPRDNSVLNVVCEPAELWLPDMKVMDIQSSERLIGTCSINDSSSDSSTCTCDIDSI